MLLYGWFVRRLRASTQGLSDRDTWKAAAKAAGIMYLAEMPMALAVLVERRDLSMLLDPSKQAWALLFGDLMLVPMMAGVCVFIWARLPDTGGWFSARLTSYAAAVPAAALVIWFRFHEAGAYDRWRYWSFGKLAHDLDNVSVFAAAVAYVLITIAAVATSARRDRTAWLLVVVLVGALGVFVALLIHDYTGLDGHVLHVQDFWGPWPRVVHCGR
jgi:hypothetical protein